MKNIPFGTVDTLACIATECELIIEDALGTSSFGNGTRLRRKLLKVIAGHMEQRVFEHLLEADRIVEAEFARDPDPCGVNGDPCETEPWPAKH